MVTGSRLAAATSTPGQRPESALLSHSGVKVAKGGQSSQIGAGGDSRGDNVGDTVLIGNSLCVDYWQQKPPSTTNSAPVEKRDSSDASSSTMLATSSGSPRRLAGVAAIAPASRASLSAVGVMSGVRI